MIIKSLLEIAFYGSWLAAKKVGNTIGEKLPFSKEKKRGELNIKVDPEPKQQINQAPKEEKTSKKITPKQEAAILNYQLKTKKELYEIAQGIDLEGRSSMSKAELIRALEEYTKNQ